MSSTTKSTSPAATPLKAQRRRGRPAHLLWIIVFLAPAVGSLVVLRIIPTVNAVASSFYEAFPGGLIPATFAGFSNYELLFTDPGFVATIWRTILFNVIINPLQIFLSLLIAVLLTRKVKLKGLWRLMLIIPITVPVVGSSIAWNAALAPRGPINTIIQALGGNPQPFFTSPSQALACIIVLCSWVGVGYWMLFLIAGIESIPEEYYEAATIDRAGPIRTFFYITIPLLRRPLLFVLVADTVANFVNFVPVQLLTGGGPQSSTTLLMFDAWQTTFQYGSKNIGAAQVVILAVIMLTFVLLQFRLLREERTPK